LTTFTDLYSLLPYDSAVLLWVGECGRGRSRGTKSLRFPGAQMLAMLKRLGKQLRHVWPDTLLLLRGNSHFACPRGDAVGPSATRADLWDGFDEQCHLVGQHAPDDQLHMRFGFDLVAHLCRRHGCELVVMNTETLSPEHEMVQDLKTITHCFSARLDGLRTYRKALDRALKDTAA